MGLTFHFLFRELELELSSSHDKGGNASQHRHSVMWLLLVLNVFPIAVIKYPDKRMFWLMVPGVSHSPPRRWRYGSKQGWCDVRSRKLAGHITSALRKQRMIKKWCWAVKPQWHISYSETPDSKHSTVFPAFCTSRHSVQMHEPMGYTSHSHYSTQHVLTECKHLTCKCRQKGPEFFFCFTFFIDVIRHHDQGNLRMKSLLTFIVLEAESVSIDWAHSSRQAGMVPEQ